MSDQRKFAPGDMVVCVDAGDTNGKIENGKIYRCTNIYHSDSQLYILVAGTWRFAERFLPAPTFERALEELCAPSLISNFEPPSGGDSSY